MSLFAAFTLRGDIELTACQKMESIVRFTLRDQYLSILEPLGLHHFDKGLAFLLVEVSPEV